MTNLTQEQQAIIQHGRDTNDHLIVEARAGSGKSFTLLELCKVLRGTTTLQAFNKAIASELTIKSNTVLDFAQRLQLDIRTVHSHGLSAWPRGAKPRVDGGKVNYIIKDLLRFEAEPGDPLSQSSATVSKLVGLAKSGGFGLSSAGEDFPSIRDWQAWEIAAEHHTLWDDLKVEDTPDLRRDIIALAIKALGLSNQRTNQIDFDDMIYLPLLHNLPLPQYDNVLLDEAQDINATRREMAFRTLKPNGRLIAVGDRYQAIYGFTGASATSLDDIQRRTNAQVLTLTTCFRCDGQIIREAKQLVPDIRCRPGVEDKGHVMSIPFEGWPANDTRPATQDFLDYPSAGDAILCRLNKPNVAVALGLLRRGKPVRIEGKDLGKRLLFHCQRASDRYVFQPLTETLLDLDTYKDEQIRLLMSKKRETAADLLEDEVEAAKLLIERSLETHGNNWRDFDTLVSTLFADDVPANKFITLSSVHKAKGREWPTVYILGRSDYMPFHRASEGWQLEQEHNLIYVAQTRAQHSLIYVTGVKSALDRGLHREVRAQPKQETACEPTPTVLQPNIAAYKLR